MYLIQKVYLKLTHIFLWLVQKNLAKWREHKEQVQEEEVVESHYRDEIYDGFMSIACNDSSHRYFNVKESQFLGLPIIILLCVCLDIMQQTSFLLWFRIIVHHNRNNCLRVQNNRHHCIIMVNRRDLTLKTKIFSVFVQQQVNHTKAQYCISLSTSFCKPKIFW